MARKCIAEFTMFTFFTIYLLVSMIERIDADDLYRCPSHIPRNPYLKTHSSRCYQFIKTEKHWFAAKDYCASKGGILITIEQKHIQAFVERSLNELRWGRNGLWIGATDNHRERDWRWVTGARVDSGYSNWDSGQPSCFLPKFFCKEDCANLRLDDGFKWHDYFCRAGNFEYSFICQYEMLPETTTTTTTTTTTKTTKTSTTTTTTTTPKLVPPSDSVPSLSVIQEATVSLLHSSLLKSNSSTKREPSSTTSAIDHFIQVDSQRMMSKDKGMETGSVVGMVVSFVLIFIAGIVVGVFLCRRRYKKRYEETVSPGFNNVLYTAAPQKTKDTNVMVAGACAATSDDDEHDADDHRYCDIDELAAGSNHVKLPNKDSGLPPEDMPPKYSTIDENEEEEGGACGSLPPTPCERVVFKQFTPEFLSKDTDVSKAYSNNIYGYLK